ncbi:Outer membrane protein transport protein (OMPP1/FadL/TodX) [Thalassovita gelatinovora]|uniref:Outer membrane protein transport protein (OMPP1/FadL/TodX) n=1 Tax=Thalassovita gelatinovora TaxID=53501 RepID=A0A0N7LU51_THAGE|nr:outer membrane protein transport protein [Thalassovita gelatinovora]QIZ79295.1 hypothetical protein HFZ77_01825 [Thalassovita gelatinovora]CUH62522.1 Outer membrane protein transport protein (OMPP1/FadL/TodX) [Thalassovita gelatinovora]SEQ05893.1 Long-chain fatty acid transport protein [Thalassovita gelatinovora]
MKKIAIAVSAVMLTAGASFAGGVDRSGQSIGILFESGNVIDFSFGHVAPSVSGVFSGLAGSGNMSDAYNQFGLGYKRDLNDKLSMAVIWDQPFGADVAYPSGTGYPLAGSTGTIDTNSLTAVLRYKTGERFSIHGGVRAIRTSGKVALPASGYSMTSDTQTDYGYLIGAAYEIPDIALRAALTYNSEVSHNLNVVETVGGVTLPTSVMPTEMPKSVNFDFQTGIAANTLLMFSARWVDWTSFNISPAAYTSVNGALVDYSKDTISYSLGLGRRFNDKLSGTVMFGFEDQGGGLTGNLGPTDGYTSIALGLKYQVNDSTAISGGVRYVWVGDATTKTLFSDFSGNSAVAAGLKITHMF